MCLYWKPMQFIKNRGHMLASGCACQYRCGQILTILQLLDTLIRETRIKYVTNHFLHQAKINKVEVCLRWKNADFETFLIWASNDNYESKITPRFCTCDAGDRKSESVNSLRVLHLCKAAGVPTSSSSVFDLFSLR